MNPDDIRTLKILEQIDKDHPPSQRDLANELNISLGLVNSFIKRLANKGYFKMVNIQKNRVKYLITPKGMAEKTRLTYEFIKLSYKFYNGARQKLRELYKNLEAEGCSRVVFYGAGDLAEIAYISRHGTSINVVAVIDNYMKGKRLFNTMILAPDKLHSLSYDKILITTVDSVEHVYKNLMEQGIPSHKIVMLQ
ncbi:MAG: winged helix-turn-helix transcriptional regulator [Deltaproteobacteria bacterium]|nr:winged helix-turn-helix transcriptional regulator [Deltaproteobacteria bacterium]